MSAKSNIPVVGIGASAGGLQSLQHVFDALDPETHAAFVVIQHLSPDHESMMRDLLARRTAMTVVQVEEDTEIRPNTVYLLRRNTELELRGDVLVPLPRSEHVVPSMPIDRFFASLAESRGEGAIAVVVSGSGTDGTEGIRTVKNHGGWVIAESTSSAQFAGMPTSAEDSGFVDSVLPADRIGVEIARRLSGVPSTERLDDETPDDRVLHAILAELREESITDFLGYRERTLRNRVMRRVRQLELESVEDYLEVVQADIAERRILAEDLLIGVTHFFRDPACFETLAEEVIPRIFDGADPQEGVRVWCAGCATGQEAYSLAMLLLEERERRSEAPPIKVFATDVHRRALELAVQGAYSEREMAGVSAERLERFFSFSQDRYHATDELREVVVFSYHDVVANPPFTRLDLITCRNMLIYLKTLTQKRVCGYFHFGLREDGYLFLGPSETIVGDARGFRPVHEKYRIYQRIDAPVRPVLHLAEGLRASDRRLQPMRVDRVERAPGRTRAESWFEIYDRILDEYMPPSFLLDEDYALMDSFAGAEEYLTVAGRRPTGRLTESLPQPASSAVAGALRRCARSSEPVSIQAVQLHRNGKDEQAEIRIAPLVVSEGLRRKFIVSIVVADRDAEAVTGFVSTDAYPTDAAALMLELESTRESLRQTVEEAEINSEELQSANEELVAANEEMQSTNEELNSVNEELHTVNTEFQRKNQELSDLHRDMVQLLDYAEIGTVFLGPNLDIRRFSPDMKSVFNITEDDIGRRITNFTHRLDVEGLPARLEDVRSVKQQIEMQVRDDAGVPRLLRLTPSVEDGELTAILVTLVDVSEIVAANRTIELERSRLQTLVDSLPLLVGQVSADLRYVLANRAYVDFFGLRRDQIVGRSVREVLGSDLYDRIEPELERVLAGESRMMEVPYRRGDDEVFLLVYWEPIKLSTGGTNGFYVAAIDITRLRDVNRKLIDARIQAEAADRAKSTFLANMSHEIRTPMSAILGHLELLERESDLDKLRASVQVVRKNGQHLLDLINDILHLSALDLGSAKIDLAPLRPAVLVADVLSLLERLAEERQIQVQAFVMESVPEAVQSDERRLRQILMNLVSNAIKFTDAGEVGISVDARDGVLRFQVRDTGRGIPAGQMEKLFQPFEQLDASGSGEGTGLGLNISARLAQQLDGYLEAESEEGVGSTFTLTVPLVEAAPAAESPRHSSVDTSGEPEPQRLPSSMRVLVADDNDDGRGVAVRFLSDAGATVDEASNGSEALEKLEAAREGEPYTVVFLDIHMPGVSGLDVVRRLREAGDVTPVVALTAGALRRDRLDALDAGCSDHVAKPASSATLVEVASRWAGRQHPSDRECTVLIVDDDSSTREGMRSLLELEEYEVVAAASFQGALRVAESQVFDVVVSDISLEDGNGGELANVLKARPGFSSTTFIAMSGWSESERPDEAVSFDHWLQKPVPLADLLDLLRRVRG